MLKYSSGLAFLSLLLAGPAWSQAARMPSAQPLGQPSMQQPAVLEEIGVDEQLGSQVPVDLAFRDEQGRSVTLGTYLGRKKPVLLNLVYHDCPMLCSLILDGLTKTMQQMEWVPGEQFEVVTVSFSPIEGPNLAARQKQKYVELLGKPEAAQGWHFLTGEEASIQALARAVGFEFQWVEAQQEYAHPAVLVFLSDEGVVTRYLYGLENKPRDVRNALVEASAGTIGTTLDRVILYCFQFDPLANSYVLHAINVMKLGGLFTLLVLGGLLFVFWRREQNRQREALVPE